MQTYRGTTYLLAGLILVWGSVVAHARITVNVPAGSPVYSYLDRLEAYGCVLPTYRATRPQSYGDLQESLIIEESNPDDEGGDPAPSRCQAPEWLLLEKQLLTRPALQNDARVSFLALRTDAIGLRGIDATVTPLFPQRENRPTYDGLNLYTEFNANAQAGRTWGIAISATPGWVGALADYRSPNGKFYLQEGYFKLGYRRAELLFGRTAMQFGETAHGSLLLSGATAPINQVKFTLRPHAFSFLGPLTFETWLSTETASRFVDDAHFAGASLALRPVSGFEVAVLELFQFGGLNRPALEPSDVLSMFAYSGAAGLEAKRQRMMAWHASLWALDHGVKFYAQAAWESLGRPANWFKNDLSTLVGVWLPRIGAGEFRFEYLRTAPNAYQSRPYPQGLSYLGSPLGHPLGPDADGVYLDFGLPPLKAWRPGLGLFYEARSRSISGAGLSPEYRYGAGLDLVKRWQNAELSLSGRLAYAANHQYLTRQNNTLGALFANWRYSFF
jgi:hypothetical protein